MKKKIRIMALVLAVAVALVGAGYAAWGTAITSTTALRTGEWKIVLENDSNASFWAGDSIAKFTANSLGKDATVTSWSDVNSDYDAVPSGEYGAVDPSAENYVYVIEPQPADLGYGIPQSAADNCTACSFSFYNLHPGTRAYTRFEIRNDGTIPAQISDVKVSFKNVDTDADRQVLNAMKVNPVFAIHHGNNGSTSLVNEEGIALKKLEELLDQELIGKVLECDNMLYSYVDSSVPGGEVGDELETGGDSELENSFCFELPADALYGNKGMNAGFQVVIEIDFVQYNQDLGLEPA